MVFIVLSNRAISQYSLGLFAGYSNNHLLTDISNRSYTQNKNGNSFGVCVAFNYEYNRSINFQSQIDLLHKDYSFVRTGNYAGIYTDYKNAYLQLPLIIQYKLSDKGKWQFFTDAGLYVSYWVFGKTKGVISNIFNSYDSINNIGQRTHYLRYASYSQKYQFDDAKDNRFELGALAGLTTIYRLNQKYSLAVNARFYQAFTPQERRYSINQAMKYNQTVFISIGYMLHLQNK
jgi:hypothetical protein